MSTGNINVHSEDFAFKLGSQLNLLRKRKESFHVIDENIGDVCEKCKEQDEDEKIENRKEKDEDEEKVTSTSRDEEKKKVEEKKDSDEENDTSVKGKEDNPNQESKGTKNEETNTDKDQTEVENSISSIEENLEGKLSSASSLRSSKTMTPQEKVRLWLPLNSEAKWDSKKNEIKVDFVLGKDSIQDKRERFRTEKEDTKDEDFENDSLNDEPTKLKEDEDFKESFETVVNAPIP